MIIRNIYRSKFYYNNILDSCFIEEVYIYCFKVLVLFELYTIVR